MEETIQNKEVKFERNSVFELLRIIAIIFIIAHHFTNHGAFDFAELGDSALIIFNRTWVDFIEQLGKVGVNLFILISSYFLIDSRGFRTKKFLSILLEMLTFAIIIGLTFFFIDKPEFSFHWLRSLFLPFGRSSWWFLTDYLILYLLSPLLNLGIKAMNKKMHLAFAIIFMVLWSILPTFLQEGYGYTDIGWFITMYIVAAYIKLYDVNIKLKPWLGILLSIGIFLSWYFIGFGFNFVYKGGNYFLTRMLGWFKLINMNNFIQASCTILLFLSFKKIQMKNCKVINIIASTTLAIYLFHDHGDVRHFLWLKLFKNATYAASPYLFIYSIGAITAVFVAGVIIGLIYRYTFYIGYDKLLSILEKKWLYKLDNTLNNLNTDTPNNYFLH